MSQLIDKGLTFSNHSKLKVLFEVPNLDDVYDKGLVKTIDDIKFSYPIEKNRIVIHKDLHTDHFFGEIHRLIDKSKEFRRETKNLLNDISHFSSYCIDILISYSDIFEDKGISVMKTEAYRNFVFYGMKDVTSISYEFNGLNVFTVDNSILKQDVVYFPLFSDKLSFSQFCTPIRATFTESYFILKGNLSPDSRVEYNGLTTDNNLLKKIISGRKYTLFNYPIMGNKYMLHKNGLWGLIDKDIYQINKIDSIIIELPADYQYKNYFELVINQPDTSTFIKDECGYSYSSDIVKTVNGLPGIDDESFECRLSYNPTHGDQKTVIIKKRYEQQVIEYLDSLNKDIIERYGNEYDIRYTITRYNKNNECEIEDVQKYFISEFEKLQQDIKEMDSRIIKIELK